MTAAYTVAACAMLVAVVVWIVLLLMAARADGRDQRERDGRLRGR
jgi:hypothetical protein